MLRRLLIVLLMLGHIAYGTAVVADGHWMGGDGHGHTLTALADGAGDDGAHAGGDHCCHAASHLTGLPGSHLSEAQPSAAVLVAAAASAFKFVHHAPLPRPPRA